ncbi:MAG: iron ABC transporter substrate-binding protein [Spirochaetales bacterium]|nr:iron ABC transporter substrate-binding protein [Spirochaetales bacterium]
MGKRPGIFIIVLVFLCFIIGCTKREQSTNSSAMVMIKDSMKRDLRIPSSVSSLICSGSGSLRYITYMECQDKVIAVDDIETKKTLFDARPYAFANPEFKALPMFGESRGNDNPELIAALDRQPDIIFKTYGEMGFNPDELQEKTNIPVVVFNYGDLGRHKPAFYESLSLIGKIMHKEKRSEEIQQFIEEIIADLEARTKDIPVRPSCFIGGVAYRGPHGLISTEPGYPPFLFLNTPNAALSPADKDFAHMDVSKEKIVEWDPDIIFIDLATLQSDPKANALYELKHDPAYGSLKAVASGNLYGVLPYNWYSQNHGSTLANAYYIGTVLYPDKFTDINPAQKADEIYTFLVGTPVFKEMSESFQNMVYKKLELK